MPVRQGGTTMKKKYLLLVAAIAIIAVSAFVLAVVLATEPGVTKANYDLVKRGMSYAEVVELFGSKPTVAYLNRRVDATGLVYWRDADGSIALVTFSDGRVVDFEWADSNETIWDKLRRWVSWK
jgi:hypothetical protein